jgi:uncharacterized protein YcbX
MTTTMSRTSTLLRTDRPDVVIASILFITSAGYYLILPLVKPAFQSLAAYLSRVYQQSLIHRRLQNPPTSPHGNGSGTVSNLFTHPIKSLRAVSQTSVTLDGQGIVGDRRYMIVCPHPEPLWGRDNKDPDMRFVTQRQFPLLATVVATIVDDNTIQLSSDQLPKSQSSVRLSSQPKPAALQYRSTLWGDIVLVQDMGDAAAEFLQSLAKIDSKCVPEYATQLRLVIQSPDDTRSVTPDYVPRSCWLLPPSSSRSSFWMAPSTPRVSLADGFPILLVCEASLTEVNRRLQLANKPTIEMSQFRPNIIVRGTAQPFEEDYWQTIQIGSVVLHLVKACPRCKQSCTNQTSGEVSDEPVTTLKEFRALDPTHPSDVFFGQNVVFDNTSMVGQSIHLDDKVTVLQWRTKPIYQGD